MSGWGHGGGPAVWPGAPGSTPGGGGVVREGSVVRRAVAMVARVVWWAWRRVAAGRDAVAVPVRMEVIRVRRVVVKDRCRAWTGCPAQGPLANGVARAAVDRVAAWRSSVATIQAACS